MADHSFQLAVATGSPRVTDGAPVASADAWSFVISVKITSYANWCAPIIVSRNNLNQAGLEFNAGGSLYYNRVQGSPDSDIAYTETNLWTDSYTGWVKIYGRFASGVQQIWYWRDGAGSGTLAVNLTESLTFDPATSVLGANPEFLSDMNGTIRYDMVKVYKATKSQAFLETEAFSRTVVDNSNLHFYNGCVSGTAINVDSGGDGNWTLTGTPTDQTDDSFTDSTSAIAAAITAAGSVTAGIKGAGAMASAIACTATIAATLIGATPAAAAVTGSGTVTADITASGALAASILTTSTVSATVPGDAAILANITAAGSVSAGLTGAGAIASSLSGSGTVTADLTVLTSGAMVAALSGAGTVSGTLAGAGALASAVTGLATLSANLTTAGAMAAALSGSATVSGTLGRLITIDLTDSVGISDAMTGGPATVASAAAAITASGTVTAAIKGAGAASAAVTASGTVAGSLLGAGVLACATTGSATVTGTLTGTKLISAALTGSATVSAILISGSSSVPILIGVSPLVTDTTGTSLTPDISGVAVQVNDVVIAHICVNQSAALSSAPNMPAGEGWTLIGGIGAADGADSLLHRSYWKRWGSGSTDDTTPTITLNTAATAWSVVLSVWRGCKRAGNPYEAEAASANTTDATGIVTAPTATSAGTARVSLRLYSTTRSTAGLDSPSEGAAAYSGASYYTTNGSDIALAAEYLTGEPAGAVGTATITGVTASHINYAAETIILAPEDSIAATITTTTSVVGALRGALPLTSSITGSAAPAASLLGAGAASVAISGTATISATLGTTAPLTADLSGSATIAATLAGVASASASIPGTTAVVGDLQGFTAGQATAAITTTTTVTATLVGAGAIAGSSTGAATVSGTAIGAGSVTAAISATATITGALVGDGALAAAVTTTATVTADAINANAGLMQASIDGTATVTSTLAASGALALSITTTTGVTGTLTNISRTPGPTSILEQFRDLVGAITASPTPRFHEAGYRRRIEVEPEGGSDHAFTIEAEPMFPGRAAFGAGFVIRRMTVKVRISYVRTGGRKGNRQVINQQATEDGVRLADVCSNPDNYASQSTGIRTVDWEGTRRETDAGTREVWETRFAVEWSAEFNGSVLS